jgi:hypothetical protein
MKKLVITAVTLLALVAAAFVALKLTPTPMSSDLSQVGQGTPAIVLAYENFSPSGAEALTRLKAVRPDYESRVRFIVADLGTPVGRTFGQRYGLQDSQAILLDGSGRAVTILASSEQALRDQLDNVIGTLR